MVIAQDQPHGRPRENLQLHYLSTEEIHMLSALRKYTDKSLETYVPNADDLCKVRNELVKFVA